MVVIVKEYTYDISIRGPTYNVPFDCDIPIWVKRIISIWKINIQQQEESN